MARGSAVIAAFMVAIWVFFAIALPKAHAEMECYQVQVNRSHFDEDFACPTAYRFFWCEHVALIGYSSIYGSYYLNLGGEIWLTNTDIRFTWRCDPETGVCLPLGPHGSYMEYSARPSFLPPVMQVYGWRRQTNYELFPDGLETWLNETGIPYDLIGGDETWAHVGWQTFSFSNVSVWTWNPKYFWDDLHVVGEGYFPTTVWILTANALFDWFGFGMRILYNHSLGYPAGYRLRMEDLIQENPGDLSFFIDFIGHDYRWYALGHWRGSKRIFGNWKEMGMNVTRCPGCWEDPCYPGVTCTDRTDYAGYRCGDCPIGMEGDGIECYEVTNCTECQDACDDFGDCFVGCYLVPPDSFQCKPCPLGYDDLNSTFPGVECVDYDACAELTDCDPVAICVDMPAPDLGYQCICPEGYVGNGTYCEDRNDCLEDNGYPLGYCYEDRCVDAPAPGTGYGCAPCPEGMSGDGRDCVDYCAQDPCYPGVECTNTVPDLGFVCGECPEGMIGDGESCEYPPEPEPEPEPEEPIPQLPEPEEPTPTSVPEEPTPVPEEPTPAPQPTPVPEEPTAPTPVPEEPTPVPQPVPEEPTPQPVPEEPTPQPVPEEPTPQEPTSPETPQEPTPSPPSTPVPSPPTECDRQFNHPELALTCCGVDYPYSKKCRRSGTWGEHCSCHVTPILEYAPSCPIEGYYRMNFGYVVHCDHPDDYVDYIEIPVSRGRHGAMNTFSHQKNVGQPTVFLYGRHENVFYLDIPKDTSVIWRLGRGPHLPQYPPNPCGTRVGTWWRERDNFGSMYKRMTQVERMAARGIQKFPNEAQENHYRRTTGKRNKHDIRDLAALIPNLDERPYYSVMTTNHSYGVYEASFLMHKVTESITVNVVPSCTYFHVVMHSVEGMCLRLARQGDEFDMEQCTSYSAEYNAHILHVYRHMVPLGLEDRKSVWDLQLRRNTGSPTPVVLHTACSIYTEEEGRQDDPTTQGSPAPQLTVAFWMVFAVVSLVIGLWH